MADSQQHECEAALGDGIFDLGAVIPRIDDAPSIAGDDLSNVVPLARLREPADDASAPLITVASEDRPVPLLPAKGWQIAVLAASLLLHGAVLLGLWPSAKSMPSSGIDAITIDIVIGADSDAGVATTPNENAAQETTAAEEEKQQTKVEQPPPEPKKEEEPPKDPVQDPTVMEVQRPREEPKPEQKETRPSVASAAASGIGRGGSQATANYRGLIAAHLARHKQYPAAARRAHAQGGGTVTFSIDGQGHVTSVSLDKSTGVPSLDQELEAMVRRSSPFPRPPDGKPMNFTVPVTFRLN